MSHDPIQNLICDTDAASACRPTRACVERIQQIVQRRRIIRRSLVGAGAMLLAMGIFAGWQAWRVHPLASPNFAAKPDIEKLEAEVAALRAEADWRAAMAGRLAGQQEKSWQLARLRRKLAEPDALQRVREQVEYAAFTMVYQADRLAANPDLRDSARQIYRDVLYDFPRTQGANTARERLSVD
jgi:hypothetical protein